MLVTLGLGVMISDLNCLCYHHYIHVQELCLMLVTLGPGAMNPDLNRLCYHHYIHVLDRILQVIVTYYVL